jgi:predicted transcriptional regulator of viral defense system
MTTTKATQEAIALFRENRGILRTAEALALGIHPRTLYALRDAGMLERLGRGLYRLAGLPPLSNPDLVTVALRVPEGVICLVSALAFHDLTMQIPHVVDVAVPQGHRRPYLEYPPLHVFRFSGAAWHEGVETYRIDDVPVRITNPAKSVADSFKYRRKLGQDIALEALKRYREHSGFNVNTLLHYARVCRVEDVLTPYLEALL